MTTIDGVVSANGGYFTRAEALDCGATDRELMQGLRDHLLVRIRRGIYVPTEIYDKLDESGRHLLLARAVVSVQRGPVALFGPTAAIHHGLRLDDHDLNRIHLLRLDESMPHTHAGVTHHIATSDMENHLVEHGGISVTDLPTTVWDVARLSTLEGGVITTDSALALRPDLEAELLELAPRYRHHPGARTGRLAIALANGLSANGGESYTRVQFYRHHIPPPELQVSIHNDRGALLGICDFVWSGHRHVGEFDGKIKYQKYLREGESPTDAVVREKRREDAIRAQGYGMTRFVWSEVRRPQVRDTMAGLREHLERSRRIFVLSNWAAS